MRQFPGLRWCSYVLVAQYLSYLWGKTTYSGGFSSVSHADIWGGVCSASWVCTRRAAPGGTESQWFGVVSSGIGMFRFCIAQSWETAEVMCWVELVQLVSSSQTPNSDSHLDSFLHMLSVWACFKAYHTRVLISLSCRVVGWVGPRRCSLWQMLSGSPQVTGCQTLEAGLFLGFSCPLHMHKHIATKI